MNLSIKIFLSFIIFSFLSSGLFAQDNPIDSYTIRDTSELRRSINLTISDIKRTNKVNLDSVYALLKSSLELKDTASYFLLCKGTEKNYFRKNDFNEQAILFLKRSQLIIGTTQTHYGNLDNTIGNYYRRLRFLVESLDYYFLSIDWHKKHAQHRTSLPLGNVAGIYLKNKNFVKALEYNQLALDYSLRLEDRNDRLYNIIYDYFRMGQIYYNLDSIPKSKEYYEKSLNASRQYEEIDPKLVSIAAAISFYSGNKNSLICKDLISEGDSLLRITTSIDNEVAINFLLEKNKHYLDIGSIKAIDPKDIQFESSYSNLDILLYSVDYYTKKNDLPNTSIYYKRLISEMQRIEREDRSNVLSSIEEKYLNIELKETNSRLAQSIAKRERISLLGLIALIFISSLLILQFINNRRRKKLNKLLKTKTREQQTLYKNLKKSNQELERFTYIASHDLKTPLRNIISFTGLLESQLKSHKDTKVQEYLSFIKNGGLRLNTLIDNTIEYSRLSSLKNVDEAQIVNLDSLVSEIENSMAAYIEDRNAKVQKLNRLPSLKIDSYSVTLIFKCLIENGIKYNKSPNPTIKISSKQNTEYLSLFFNDNGIGISEDYHDKIFEMYSRLHNHNEYEGSGLGLSNCKKILEALNGELLVLSSLGYGSTFEIRLPMGLVV